MDSWVLCVEVMPKREASSAYSDWVLVTIEIGRARITWFAQYRFIDQTWWDPEGRQVNGVTAWRDLPEPFDGMRPRWRPAATWNVQTS